VQDPVIEYLEGAISDGELRPGGRLPTERSLAETLGVARTAVRRALSSMEQEGRIIRHVGRGTFLADATGGGGGGTALMTSPAEIMDTRLIFEPEIAFHAAHSATPTDLGRIENAMRRGNAASTYAEFEGWDSSFHRAITASVHNGLLLHTFDAMNTARDLPVWGTSKLRAATADRRRAYEAEHEALFAALTDRDAAGARALMREHLESVRRNLLNPPE
jgi:DNA-binding FadR family transcriptional regulator